MIKAGYLQFPVPPGDHQRQANQALGKLVECIQRTHHGHRRQQDQQPAAGNPPQRKQRREYQKAEHADVLEQVVAGDDLAYLPVAGVELDQGVQRHDIKTAHHTDGEEVEAVRQRRIQRWQQDQTDPDTDRADGDKTGFNMAPGAVSGQPRADRDTDTGGRQDALNNHGIGDIEGFLGEGGKRRQHHLTGGPEYRQPDHRQADDRVVQDRLYAVDEGLARAITTATEPGPGVAGLEHR